MLVAQLQVEEVSIGDHETRENRGRGRRGSAYGDLLSLPRPWEDLTKARVPETENKAYEVSERGWRDCAVL